MTTTPSSSAPRLLLATNNAKKAKELQALCADRFTVVTAKDLGLDVDVVEDAPDFAGNARKKAEGFAATVRAAGLEVAVIVADDSGLAVDALDGAPGVRSARFAADHDALHLGATTDDANNALLLQRLSGVNDDDRGARFVCAVCAARVDGSVVGEAFGEVQGRIARDLSGAGGFGYDPLFVVTDAGADDATRGRRMAELEAVQKHAISHRGRAMRQLLQQL